MADSNADPVLNLLLSELACPYDGGTRDSVIWLHGYRAGLLRAANLLETKRDAALRDLAGEPAFAAPPPERPN